MPVITVLNQKGGVSKTSTCHHLDGALARMRRRVLLVDNDPQAVRETVHGYGVGGFAFLSRCVVEHRDVQALRTAVSWFVHHHMRQLARWVVRRPGRSRGPS